ncbi:hypothetical protein [Pseudorhodoferax soli]|uniref:Uncharacterized protein n=1 Tax=Pseudorhodoferax soli TaxID=545864 RepID=A0A368XKJ4_9BURK|nr:hypothetical protein [Pseudorhodoferax soli]RCW68483.1 hypothetical protein DES41_1074 [Pseudorhodoferax soli]
MADSPVVTRGTVPLPEPYASWRSKFQEAKSVLDGLVMHHCRDSLFSFTYGCICFTNSTIRDVRRSYEVDHPAGELMYDLVQAEGLIALALSLMESADDGPAANRDALATPDPLLVHRLCRACSRCMQQVLSVLPVEALYMSEE